MEKTGKLILGFLCVALVSAGVSLGVYSYLNKGGLRLSSSSDNTEFNQGYYHAVGFRNAAENTDFTKAAEQSVNGVVHIKSIAKRTASRGGGNYFDPFEFFFGRGYQQQAPQERVGFGSGVIISVDGYIVTNNHVIDGADEIEVTTNHNETYKAKLIGGDSALDIALLKIEADNLSVIPFGDSDNLKVGEWVLAVGNPFNLTSTVTAGIVSATGRQAPVDPRSSYGNRSSQLQQQAEKIQSYIQTDAAVNPGNSGGALVNTQGELIGINTMIVSETGNFVGYSFAVPVNLVKKAVTDIKQFGMVQRAVLGVSVQEMDVLKERNPDEYNKLKIHEGVYVAEFPSTSSAKKAGMEVGDVITAINGSKIRHFADLRAHLTRYSPGDKVSVKVNRYGKEHTLTVELKNDQGTTEVIKNVGLEERLGASFTELTREMKSRAGVNYGLSIKELKNGKMKKAGIKEGFILLTANDQRLSSVSDLDVVVKTVMRQDPDDRGLFIKGFYPNGRVEFYAIDLNE